MFFCGGTSYTAAKPIIVCCPSLHLCVPLPPPHPIPTLTPLSRVFNVSSAFPSWTPHHDHIWNVLAFMKQSFYDKAAWKSQYEEGEGEEGKGEAFDEAAFRQEAQQCVKESLQSIHHPKDDGRAIHALHTHAHSIHAHMRVCTHTHTHAHTPHSCCSMPSLLYSIIHPCNSGQSDIVVYHHCTLAHSAYRPLPHPLLLLDHEHCIVFPVLDDAKFIQARKLIQAGVRTREE